MANFPTSAPNLKTDYVDNVDDVMADNQNTPNEEVNAIAGKIGTGASTPTAGLFLQGTGTGTSAWNTLNAPQGFMLNGKIVPSVTSDNLTVALKTLAGTDPSASDPVHIRIGDTIRTITSALSTTLNAGFNYYNSGSSELATKEVDYFVYLGYNTTNGIQLGFARVPYATNFSELSTVFYNEKYAGASFENYLSSGDVVENIGRFAATLSAGAGYTWSVPTFTSTNLIQRPIFETRTLRMTPTKTGTESMTVAVSGSDELCRYKISGNTVEWHYGAILTRGGTASYQIDLTLPMSASTNGSTGLNPNLGLGGFGGEHSNGSIAGGYIQYGTLDKVSFRNFGGNYSLGTFHHRFSATYFIS